MTTEGNTYMLYFSYLIYRLRACVGSYQNPECFIFGFPGSLSFLPIQSIMLFHTVAKEDQRIYF